VTFPHLFGLRYREILEIAAIGLFLISWLVYSTVRVVQARTLLGIPNCPKCSSTSVEKAPEPSLADGFFRMFGCRPYRCYGCGIRHFRAG
jgi:hypothetical protein